MARPPVILRIRRARIRAEVAHSFGSLLLGLMFRRRLAPDHGLLLRFPWAANHTIHMLFVRFPLDLLFIRPDATIARIHQGRPGLHFYRAGQSVKSVLELNAGFCRRHGLAAGDRVRTTREARTG